MGETTNIGWVRNTDGSKGATINFWIGCTKVSEACDNCYAEALNERFGWAPGWGAGVPRYYRIENAAKEAFKLQRKAIKLGIRIRVFSNSLSDVFDNEVSEERRHQVMAVISLTPNLDWLILTKRPKVARDFLGADPADGLYEAMNAHAGELMHWDKMPERSDWPMKNLWLGTTVENQAMADLRLPILLDTPAAIHFVSIEPLLGRIDLYRGGFSFLHRLRSPAGRQYKPLDWVIIGGESGPDARDSNLDLHREVISQCQAFGVPVFEKQLGRLPVDGGHRLKLVDSAGADPSEWPEDLRVQEMPEVAHA